MRHKGREFRVYIMDRRAAQAFDDAWWVSLTLRERLEAVCAASVDAYHHQKGRTGVPRFRRVCRITQRG